MSKVESDPFRSRRGRLRLLATITQREVIERILAHLGRPTDPVVPEPARHEEELFA